MHRIAVRALNSSALILSDLALLSLSLAFAVVESYRNGFDESLATYLDLRISVRNVGLLLLCLASWRLALWAVGLYRSVSAGDLFKRVVMGVLFCTPTALLALTQRETGGSLARPVLLFVVVSTLFLLSSRGIVGMSAALFHAHARPRRVAVIVGSGNIARKLAADLMLSTEADYKVLGYFDSSPVPGCTVGPYLGGIDMLADTLMHTAIDDVFVGLPAKSRYDEIQRVVEMAGSAGIQAQLPAKIVHTSVAKRLDHSGERMVMKMTHHDSRRYIKRVFDVAVASLCLLLFSPLLLLVAVLIKLTSKGPIFFHQQRYGLNKRRFNMIKFRSMVVDAEALQAKLEHLNETTGPVFKMKSDPRITWIGSLIRKTSIDELPQLWNVLRGEMSLVGPRPLPLRDVNRFEELRLMRRFSVLPGMTGLWQVSGRSQLGFDSWVDLDLRYIDEWTLSMDMKILAMTIPAVLRGSGAA